MAILLRSTFQVLLLALAGGAQASRTEARFLAPAPAPINPAEHCNSRTIPSHQVLTSAPPIHRRLDLVRGLLLDNWRQKRAVATTGLIHLFLSSSKRIDVPGEVEVDGEAASGLRPRNSKVHVGAAAVALLSLATVMCML
ncbi:unnamed protein product [Parascedosporium putredinis]|uniref:Uncharacterized protein n=1 Tax=Parascedosporium putredinis TaxID=1442378 RepID=A0A9P1MER6_9PEZI|nr:unnamed protein product [Parascedosporium putredinis]CAI8001032.1 unnamed protein product [Parascedosporium putredinis]